MSYPGRPGNNKLNLDLSWQSWSPEDYFLRIKPYIMYVSDVCALLKNNISSQALPHKICELITKYNNATECHFSRAIVIGQYTYFFLILKISRNKPICIGHFWFEKCQKNYGDTRD